MTDNSRIRGLQRWLSKNITPHISRNREVQNRFLNSAALKIFDSAFTHESYPDADNYERLEVLGDQILKLSLTQLIMSKYRDLTPMGVSNMVSHYSSDIIQKEFMNDIGAVQYIRVNSSMDDIKHRVAGDVFESLFGAVYLIADEYNQGSGYLSAYNLTLKFYGRYPFDMKLAEGNYKTVVQQIFNRFDGVKGPTESIPNQTPHSVKVQIKLNKSNIDLLKRYGIRRLKEGEIIGQADGVTKSEVMSKAYKEALSTLEEHGINNEWASSTKFIEDIKSSQLKNLWPQVVTKLEREGYDHNKVRFEHSRKISKPNEGVFTLAAYDEQNKRTILSSARGTNDTIKTKAELLESYLNA